MQQLGVSNKTISKWERGNGFPEISLLLPLCNELDLSVNELLTGERISETEYREKAEENMVNLVKEAQESKAVISAISKSDWTTYSMDLRTDSFEEVVGGEVMHRLTGSHGCASEAFRTARKSVVSREDQKTMREFFEVTTLAARLQQEETIAREYLATDGHWHMGRFIVKQRDANGTVTEVLYVARDITEEKKQEFEYQEQLKKIAQEAEKANISKTDFLRRMSHDIRTPINGICGVVNMADHYADDMEKQTEYRTKIKEASNLLLELVNDVLDMSRLESGEVVMEEIPFNLSSISKEVLIVIKQIAAEQNIRIVWEKKEIIHRELIGSPGHVKRVMMNILSNAVKYNRANGYIYLSCREIPSEQTEMPTMEFVCRDTGIGMTEEFQKYVFEPFAQEHTGSRTKFAGTGLGMAISKKLVEKMGGTINLESEKGVGTTFVIRVPFRINTDRSGKVEIEKKSEASIRGLHILLAEDNELNMEISEFVLRNEGADVTKAWNGQEAVERFRKSRVGEFNVILMDIMMPVKNGYEAARLIRSLDREDAKTIPIIAMTANAFTEDRIRAKEAGMDEHVAKPVDAELLVKVIHKLAGS